MKNQLKNHIVLLKEPSSYQHLDFDKFISATMNILAIYNCKFRYLRVDSKRNGHVKVKINRLTGEHNLELAINKSDNIGGQLYTIIHELTHLLNNHMLNKDISKKQAEVVADSTALYFVAKYSLLDQYLTSDVAKKWDVLNYSNFYIDNMQLSKRRYDLIIRQIIDSKLTITKLLLENDC